MWHGYAAPAAYRRDTARFASEFGLQAPPDPEVLARFLAPAEIWPPGQGWTWHGAGLKKLWRYARPFLGEGEVTLATFVQASQRAQAHGLQIAIEHHRRARRQGGGGALAWQLNEPWPAISWAIVDFYRNLKPAYEAVKRAFNPLLVSLDYPLRPYRSGEILEMEMCVLNDTPRTLSGCQVQVLLEDEAGNSASERRPDEPESRPHVALRRRSRSRRLRSRPGLPSLAPRARRPARTRRRPRLCEIWTVVVLFFRRRSMIRITRQTDYGIVLLAYLAGCPSGRILTALANPFCTMLGHASGRLLLARESYAHDLEAILKFAGAHQVIVEINASPYRLDLDWRWLRRARELGILISINPDAHSLEGLDDVNYGVMVARKGWLAPEDVLNTYPPAEVAEILGRRRAG